ncbi:RNA polymerase sigma factor [Solibaculum mannosilyticum]|uniref:RNA polymerase sigma factor n=1 Tax=Solibaculum mannosilyticum TaxID=2780922 RepID=UPI0034BCF868
MAYNKGRAEREWLKWKQAEEQIMRQLGIDETTIEKIRLADWEQFKSDRRFYERLQETDTYLDQRPAKEPVIEIQSAEQLLAQIESEKLYQALLTVDKLTLQIVLLRIEGYSSKEIAEQIGLTVNAVDLRLFRLKNKLKKFLQ